MSKINLNKFKTLTKQTKDDCVVIEINVGNKVIPITVKKYLTYAERLSCIELYKSLISKDDGEYESGERYYVEDLCLLAYFTDIDFELEENNISEVLEIVWALITKTDIISKIKESINKETLEQMSKTFCSVAEDVARHTKLDIILTKINQFIEDAQLTDIKNIDFQNILSQLKDLSGKNEYEIVKAVLEQQKIK